MRLSNASAAFDGLALLSRLTHDLVPLDIRSDKKLPALPPKATGHS